MLHNLKHYQVLHARNVLLKVHFTEEPWVPKEQRVQVTALPGDFWQVHVEYGFKDEPDIPAALALCASQGLEIDPFRVVFSQPRAGRALGQRRHVALAQPHVFRHDAQRRQRGRLLVAQQLRH